MADKKTTPAEAPAEVPVEAPAGPVFSGPAVEVLVGSTQYRSRFELRGYRNEDRVFVADPVHVLEADYDIVGNVAPGMLIRISEDYAAHLCDGQMKHKKLPGRPARTVRLATRLSDVDNARAMLNAFRANSFDKYALLYPRGHEHLFTAGATSA